MKNDLNKGNIGEKKLIINLSNNKRFGFKKFDNRVDSFKKSFNGPNKPFKFKKFNTFQPKVNFKKTFNNLNKKNVSGFGLEFKSNNKLQKTLYQQIKKKTFVKIIKRKKFKILGRRSDRRKKFKTKRRGLRSRNRRGSRFKRRGFYFKRSRRPYRFKFRRKVRSLIRKAFKSIISKILTKRAARFERLEELRKREEKVSNKQRWNRSGNRDTKKWKWLEKNWAREKKIVLTGGRIIRRFKKLNVRLSNLFIYRNLKNNFAISKIRKIYRRFFKFRFYDKAMTKISKGFSKMLFQRSRKNLLIEDFKENRRIISLRRKIIPYFKVRLKWSIRNRLITNQSDLFFYRHFFSKGFRMWYSDYFKKFLVSKLLSRNFEQTFSLASNRVLLSRTRKKFFSSGSRHDENGRRFFRFLTYK